MPTTDAFAIRRKIIGVLLQGARLRAGRTKKECADVIGVSPAILTAYEEGSPRHFPDGTRIAGLFPSRAGA